jgi:cyclin A
MRAILIDWMVEVVSEFRMEKEVLFLAVFYIDCYLAEVKRPIARGKLQLLGVTCLLIAAYPTYYYPFKKFSLIAKKIRRNLCSSS